MPGIHGRGGRGSKLSPPQGIMTRERLHALLVGWRRSLAFPAIRRRMLRTWPARPAVLRAGRIGARKSVGRRSPGMNKP